MNLVSKPHYFLWILTAIFFAGCTSNEFKEARESLRQGKFYIAIEHYMSFAKREPKNKKTPEALLEVGNIQYTVLGEPERAIQTFKMIVSSYPVNITTLTAQKKIADIYKSHFSNYDQAIIEYEKFIHGAPNHEDVPHILMELAHCHTMVHDFQKANQEYDQIIQDYPNFSRLDETYFQKGNNYFISAEYEKSLKAYQTVVNQFPESAVFSQAIFGLANVYEELDDFQKARDNYRKILKTYPSPNVIRIRLKGVEDREANKNNRILLKQQQKPKTRKDFELWQG